MWSTFWRGAGALTTVLALSGTAHAQQPDKKKPRPRQIVDIGVEAPVTTPADVVGEAVLDQMLSRSSEGLVEVAQPDGTVSLDLQGRFMSVMLVSPDASGRPVVSCLTGRGAPKDGTHTDAATSAAAAAPKASLVREIK